MHHYVLISLHCPKFRLTGQNRPSPHLLYRRRVRSQGYASFQKFQKSLSRASNSIKVLKNGGGSESLRWLSHTAFLIQAVIEFVPMRHLFPEYATSSAARSSILYSSGCQEEPQTAKILCPSLHQGHFSLYTTQTQDDGLLYVDVDPFGSDAWKLDPIVELLKEGAVGVISTDTVYAIACDLRSHSAIDRLRRIKNIDPSKPLSILCRSFKDIDTYTTGFPRGNSSGLTNIFRAVKHCLPGPYTFILTASKELPKQCTRYGTATSKYAPRKNVGVRMPDDAVCQEILEKMDVPLISTSVKSPKENEWILDPVVIADVYGPEGLDFVVNAGIRVADPSTVVDMTGNSPRIIRQGKGPKQPWMIAEDSSVEVSDLLAS